jgi:hypothetical protein
MKKIPASHWRLTARLHNRGVFNFGGRVGSDNPTFDVNFTYERKKWGLLFFKGLDFVDHSTFYNFSLVALYKNFRISKSVTFTPYAGTFLEQANGVADKGSDAVIQLVTSVKISPRLSFEEMSMFGNLVFEPEERDWVNRFRLTYTGKHLDVVTSLWHNNQVFDSSSYWSTGVNVAYSRIPLADHLFLTTGVTGLLVLKTSDEVANPQHNTIMFTIGLQMLH